MLVLIRFVQPKEFTSYAELPNRLKFISIDALLKGTKVTLRKEKAEAI